MLEAVFILSLILVEVRRINEIEVFPGDDVVRAEAGGRQAPGLGFGDQQRVLRVDAQVAPVFVTQARRRLPVTVDRELTTSVTPSPSAIPWMRQVLPAPSSPLSATSSPGCNAPASGAPTGAGMLLLLGAPLGLMAFPRLRPR